MRKVVILGAGPGGYSAALRGANLGFDVTLIEKEQLGGTCLNWGCIPTKTYYHSTKVLRELKEFKELKGDYEIDYLALFEKQKEVVKQLVSGLESLLKNAGVKVIKGQGKLTKAGVLVDDNLIEADNTIIATGASPLLILGIKPDAENVFTAKEIWQLKSVPESVIILGGGVIGVELATIFSELGVEVTVVEKEKTILPQFRTQAVRLVTKSLQAKGVELKTNTLVTGYRDGVLETKTGNLTAEILLLALGNKPNTTGLGLEELGIKLNGKKEIMVDADLKTSIDGIYAIGDVNNLTYKLAHAASHQGVSVAEKLAGLKANFNEDLVPRTVFTDPELAEVGVLEGKKSRFPFSANGRALASGINEGFIEVYGDQNKLRGVLLVGPEASELSNLASLALATGAKKEDLAKAIFTHPTLGEAFMEASLGLFGAAIHMVKRD